jgi:hypothetical protein
MYKAKVHITGKKIAKIEPLQVLSYSSGPQNLQDINYLHEDEIQIIMTETEYNKFIRGYGDYLDLIYGIQDPIVREMFEKMMMYIKLKK